MSVNKFHGSKALIKNGLSQFNYADTIRFFKELGIPAYDNAGYIYPNSRQAASVVGSLSNGAYEASCGCENRH